MTPALAPGGELVVVDALLEGDPARDRARSIYALHLAMRTRRGRIHPRTEVERWCRDAGLGEGELVTLNAPARALGALIHRRPRRTVKSQRNTTVPPVCNLAEPGSR